MRRANNTGTIYKLSGARHNPWTAKVCTGYDKDGKRKWLKAVLYIALLFCDKFLKFISDHSSYKADNLIFAFSDTGLISFIEIAFSASDLVLK
jgi:hypothetical protein